MIKKNRKKNKIREALKALKTHLIIYGSNNRYQIIKAWMLNRIREMKKISQIYLTKIMK